MVASSRMIERFAELTGISNPISRAGDIDRAKINYHILQSNLQVLISCLKEHKQNISSVAKSRLKIAQQIKILSKDTPLAECSAIQESNTESRKCYVNITDSLDKRSDSLINKFRVNIIDYTVEWKTIMKEQVTESLASFEKARLEYDHYQRKMAHIQKTMDSLEMNEKPIDSILQQKKFRNEGKLEVTQEAYSLAHDRTARLLKEVTERGWKDLHPLFMKLAQFDYTYAAEQACISKDLNEVILVLQRISRANGISKTPRIENLMDAYNNIYFTGSTRDLGNSEKTLSPEPRKTESRDIEDDFTRDALVLYQKEVIV